MARRSKILICTLYSVLCILLPGCRPKGVLHSWEMRRVLVDLHKTDALLQVSGKLQSPPEVKAIYYSQVLEKHGITQAQFDSSLVWYTAHPQLFDKIYPKVLKDLQAEEEAFLALHGDELEIFPGVFSTSSAPTPPTFTQAQLDSVLWVTQHGYPSSWQPMPLVHDLEDELFPQIGVLR